MDAEIHAKWAKLSAFGKSYPGAPPPANWGSQGFNVSMNVQDFQAKIPQFFNFIGSSVGNVHDATEVLVTKSADSPRKEKSAQLSSIIEEESSTVSASEEARIWKEVRSMVNQQFAEARAKLESNPVAQVNISKSANPTADVDIIDLISQSVASSRNHSHLSYLVPQPR